MVNRARGRRACICTDPLRSWNRVSTGKIRRTTTMCGPGLSLA